jgi:monofunctional biosynthetic peptidoglycan transglycosylase
MQLPRFRTIARGVAGIGAAGFACLVYIYLTLPDVRTLKSSNPSTTAFMELREREARGKGQTPRHVQQWVSYKRISPSLTRAVLVAEDDAFWQHEGLDVEQLERSLEINWASGSVVRGGSTITQQLAKNLYLSPSKNPIRKLKELIIARRLEAELDKSRILELYLNVIEWGDGVYGAEAAARRYFQTSAASLGPAQAALLAGAIINPRVLNPARPNARLRRRQAIIMGRMGAVTPPPAVEAVPSPAAADARPETHGIAPDDDVESPPIDGEAPLNESPVDEPTVEPEVPEQPASDSIPPAAEPTGTQ